MKDFKELDGRGAGDWEALGQAVRSLPPVKAGLVRTLEAQAMTYVWGFQDAGGEDTDSERSWQFSRAYGWHAYLYATEQIGFRRNIKDAWRLWRERHSLNQSEWATDEAVA